MPLRALGTVLIGAIGASLFAKVFGSGPDSPIFNIYIMVYGGSIIYAAWEDHQEWKPGARFYMFLGGLGILHGFLAIFGVKLF